MAGNRFPSSRFKAALSFTLALLVPAALMLSCGGEAAESTPRPEPRVVRPAAVPQVHMCGRSVMDNWFSHWGGDDITVSGYQLLHHYVSGPPGIVAEVNSVGDAMPSSHSALFYKLCFVDFAGGSSGAAAANLAANSGYADQVVDHALNVTHRPVILGNALPQVASDTDPWLVWNHREYNDHLAALEAAHPGQVFVFDLYGLLSTPEGWLEPAYTDSSSDSHPNGAGYDRLEGPYIELLGEVFPAAPPSVSSITPGSGGITGGVTISGSFFGNSQGSSQVLFGGVDSGHAVSWSDAAIVTCVPASLPAGAVNVTVRTAGGESAPIAFFVNDTDAEERYFAEGYTGAGFDEWLCVGNFEPVSAYFTLQYLGSDGSVQTWNHWVPAGGRATISANSEAGAAREISALLLSQVPLVAERPMYFDYGGRTGGHTVIGAPAPSTEWYFAEGYTGAGFDEYICVMNPQAAPASLSFRFQTGAGEQVIPGLSVGAHSRASWLVNDLLGPGREASLALSSDRPVVAERPMYFTYGGATGGLDWTGGHCVMGATSLATSYSFSEGNSRDGFEEWLTLQNPQMTALTVQVRYEFGPGQGDPVTRNYGVGAGARSTIFIPSQVPAGRDVSISATSASLFLAERPIYFRYTGFGADWTGGHCVIGAVAPATTWSFAEGYTGTGFHEYLCLQNPGAAESMVEISYYTQEAGALAPRIVAVPAASRLTVLVNADAGSGYQLSTRLRVVSGPAVVAERPMYFDCAGRTGGHNVIGYGVSP
ncbi:MAG: IPT/TIG domain-containing protein [Candidatus Geothermincolia bacterium]